MLANELNNGNKHAHARNGEASDYGSLEGTHTSLGRPAMPCSRAHHISCISFKTSKWPPEGLKRAVPVEKNAQMSFSSWDSFQKPTNRRSNIGGVVLEGLLFKYLNMKQTRKQPRLHM